MKKITLLLTLLFHLLCNVSVAQDVMENEILWDTWGIPHIYAKSDYALYKMAGWSQMKNHGNLLLKLYGEARGRSAEYWGIGLERDKLLHTLGLIANSKHSYEALPAKEREVLESFAAGINLYADKNRDKIDEKYRCVLPVLPVDILAHAYRVFYFEFLINRNLKKAAQITAGSNAWAVNGRKTKNGSCLLLANPHLPWSDCWMFFETQYITPGNNLYGVTLVGLPIIGIGFNQFLGWTHTVNTLDNVDFYQLEIRDNKYKLDGTYYSFDLDTLRFKVRRGDIMSEEVIVRKKSVHGIIVKEWDSGAIAIRFPHMDGSVNLLKQWEEMGQANSVPSFEAALKTQTIPLFNTLYADKKGNIMYDFGGNIPKKRGDWSKWQSTVPGSTKEDIWTNYYAFDELPHVINPKNGWLQNANDPPFTNTIPPVLDPSKYPSHITPNRMDFRAQRSASLLLHASDLTLEDFISLKHDTHSELALRLKDDIANLKSRTHDSSTLAALEVLDKWDGGFDSASKGAVLFINFINNLGGNNLKDLFQTKWSFQHPLETPDGFREIDHVLVILDSTAKKQLEQYHNLEINYGDIYRIKVGNHEFAANGGYDYLGLFRALSFQQKSDGRYYAFGGDSFVCAIEFGKSIRAKALLGYGNASQPGNVHVGDQLTLFGKKTLRDVWLQRKEHEHNLELREKIDGM